MAFGADIASMFFQVKLHPRDWDSLRFLWWQDGDLSQPLQDYQMMVHLFGAKSSPACANYALKRVAEDNTTKASSEAVSVVKRAFYVDDCLKSVDSEEYAVQLVAEVKSLLKSGGFNLTKFTSNCRNVLNALSEDDRSPDIKNLELGTLPVTKTLGLHWNMNADTFEIHVNLRPKPLTRRGILSQASQLFDPFGVIQPFILPVKQLLQRLCQVNLGWDDELSSHEQELWLRALPKLQTISIPRWFGTCLKDVGLELHCFSDTSEVGYGAVCYLRIANDSRPRCYFLLGKSRVAPLKVVTVPGLELSAAVVCVKLSKLFTKEMEINFTKITFWTDSMAVLQYIRNSTRRFNVFVANRLTVIHSASKVCQWRHVDSARNPADTASRGLMPGSECKLWLEGPGFLWQSEEHWPENPNALAPLSDDDPEIKKVKAVATNTLLREPSARDYELSFRVVTLAKGHRLVNAS